MFNPVRTPTKEALVVPITVTDPYHKVIQGVAIYFRDRTGKMDARDGKRNAWGHSER